MKKYNNGILEKVICNKCGKELKVDNQIIGEGVFSVDYKWGYFSEKDSENHKFDLCENCYDKIVSQFVYPIENKEYKELI